MADEDDGEEGPEESGGKEKPVYTPKNIGNEFVHLIECMSEIARETHKIVYETDSLKKQLEDYHKKTLFYLRPYYKENKAKIKAGVEDLDTLTRDIFKENYKDYGDTQAKLTMHGVLPSEISHEIIFQGLDSLIAKPYDLNWLYATIFSDTRAGQVKGELFDNGMNHQPEIKVTVEKIYSSNPKEFITRVLSLEDIKLKKTLDAPLSSISFKPDSKEKLWFNSVLGNPEIFKNQFNSNQFFSEIAAERSKTFTPNANKTKGKGLETNFDLLLETYPLRTDKQPDISLCAKYEIKANRTDLFLPQEELKWLEDTINAITKSP